MEGTKQNDELIYIIVNQPLMDKYVRTYEVNELKPCPGKELYNRARRTGAKKHVNEVCDSAKW